VNVATVRRKRRMKNHTSIAEGVVQGRKVEVVGTEEE